MRLLRNGRRSGSIGKCRGENSRLLGLTIIRASYAQKWKFHLVFVILLLSFDKKDHYTHYEQRNLI